MSLPQYQETTTQRETSFLNDAEGLEPSEFKRVFRNHAAGVALVAADDGAGPVALTATSVFSVSAEPPLFVFSISGRSSSGPTICNAETVVVHLLAADQVELAKLGATSGVDRFADRDSWSRLVTGEPFFLNTPVWVRGRIVQLIPAGESTLVLIHALQAGFENDEAVTPLVYHSRTWHGLGEASAL